jgi:hypothetical protein
MDIITRVKIIIPDASCEVIKRKPPELISEGWKNTLLKLIYHVCNEQISHTTYRSVSIRTESRVIGTSS